MTDDALEISKDILGKMGPCELRTLAEAVVKQSEALRDAEGAIKMCDDFFKVEQKYILEIVTSGWLEKYGKK